MSAKKTKLKRRTYTPDFKDQAIDLAKELGVKKAAEKLGIPGHQTLATWVRFEKKMTTDKEFRASEDLKAEVKKLKKELEKERKVVAIFKDAAAFFCKENMK